MELVGAAKSPLPWRDMVRMERCLLIEAGFLSINLRGSGATFERPPLNSQAPLGSDAAVVFLDLSREPSLLLTWRLQARLND